MRYSLKSASAAILLVCITGVAAQAQSYGGDRMGWGPRMMGPGMMGGVGYGRMCSPSAAGFADWRTERLERALKLTDSQREPFEAFKKASSEASEVIRDGCPRDFAANAPARMKAMEDRMDAMLRALKIVRPALDALYATLSNDQKAIFDQYQYRHRGWRR